MALPTNSSARMQHPQSGGWGPYGKTWPRCESHRATKNFSRAQKDAVDSSEYSPGHRCHKRANVPESNFAFEQTKAARQAGRIQFPFFVKFLSELENGRSVPFSRVTLYCSGVSICFHSSFVLVTFMIPLALR